MLYKCWLVPLNRSCYQTGTLAGRTMAVSSLGDLDTLSRGYLINPRMVYRSYPPPQMKNGTTTDGIPAAGIEGSVGQSILDTLHDGWMTQPWNCHCYFHMKMTCEIPNSAHISSRVKKSHFKNVFCTVAVRFGVIIRKVCECSISHRL